MKPFCFVLLPRGKKQCADGGVIDFDAVYDDLIAQAIAAAELRVIRPDEESTGDIISKPMFERMMLCDFAVFDLTLASADMYFAIGIRHAARRCRTLFVCSEGSRASFDIGDLQPLPYRLTHDGKPADIENTKPALARKLIELQTAACGCPFYLFDVIKDKTIVDHEKTDVFRDQVPYAPELKRRLAAARKSGSVDQLRMIEKELGDMRDAEGGVVVDLLLSYRSLQAWPEMIALTQKMSGPLAATVMIQEQLALALNRAGKSIEAEDILLTLIDRNGPNSETNSLLGRVYKDRWEQAVKNHEETTARDWLEKAVDAYLKGFEADWRDAFPGINTVTLMELQETADPRREQIIPVVRYAVERKIAAGRADYWDFATRLELAVLAKDEARAGAALADALAAVREVWEPQTTARNLRLIREVRERRRDIVPWAAEIEKILLSGR